MRKINELELELEREFDSSTELISLDGFPPEVIFVIIISIDFKVTAYKKHVSEKQRLLS